MSARDVYPMYNEFLKEQLVKRIEDCGKSGTSVFKRQKSLDQEKLMHCAMDSLNHVINSIALYSNPRFMMAAEASK